MVKAHKHTEAFPRTLRWFGQRLKMDISVPLNSSYYKDLSMHKGNTCVSAAEPK